MFFQSLRCNLIDGVALLVWALSWGRPGWGWGWSGEMGEVRVSSWIKKEGESLGRGV